jgi:hypothetical protein
MSEDKNKPDVKADAEVTVENFTTLAAEVAELTKRVMQLETASAKKPAQTVQSPFVKKKEYDIVHDLKYQGERLPAGKKRVNLGKLDDKQLERLWNEGVIA